MVQSCIDFDAYTTNNFVNGMSFDLDLAGHGIIPKFVCCYVLSGILNLGVNPAFFFKLVVRSYISFGTLNIDMVDSKHKSVAFCVMKRPP